MNTLNDTRRIAHIHSSASSSPSTDDSDHPRSAFEAFFASRSRVVRLHNLPPMPETLLPAVFFSAHPTKSAIRMPIPATMWELRDEYIVPHTEHGIWAVFSSHEEACLALTLGGHTVSVATALESDLEPFHKLKRFILATPSSSIPNSLSRPTLDVPMLRLSSSHSDLQPSTYTLSSNPPNPKTNFRYGDWICHQPKCAAHNFGRNLSCIGCGCPRSGNGSNSVLSSQQQQAHQGPISLSHLTVSSSRVASSPRFNSNNDPTMSANTVYYSSAQPNQQQHLNAPNLFEDYARTKQQQQSQSSATLSAPIPQQQQIPSRAGAAAPLKPSHPILTPSGRAFAIGGKVQNISSDPLSPCVMYWPDNEPFPEQGQIRPSNVVGVTPPILNTGNRGPISHQPGDWICQKCNYLNWRRRKVCQTCLPYAEGNGDSISAAVQAERIALLTQVLSQTHLSTSGSGGGVRFPPMTNIHPSSTMTAPGSSLPLPPSLASRSSTLTPPQVRRSAAVYSTNVNNYPTDSLALPDHIKTLHRSQSHLTLNTQLPHPTDHRHNHHTNTNANASDASYASLHYSPAIPIYQTTGHGQRHQSPLPQSAHLHPYQQQPSQQHVGQFLPQQQHRTPSPLYSSGPAHQFTFNPAAFNKVIGSNPLGHSSRVSLNSNASSGASSFASESAGSKSRRGSPNGGVDIHTPAPLLPSFLQDIVQSPSLSPTSTTTVSSSGDLSSLDDDDDFADFGPGAGRFTRPRVSSGSSAPDSTSGAVGSIWKLDGEETKSLTGYPQEMGMLGRKTSREVFAAAA